MARSVRHLTGIAALLAERGIDLAGRFTFHMLAAMDEMLADLISEGTKKAWPPPGPQPGRRPQAQALCPAGRGGQGMYAETGSDGKRRYAVDEVAGTFAVSRKSICRHRDKNDAQRQPDKSARPRPVTRPGDTGTLVDQLRKRDPNQPTALRAWRTSHGWQLEPEPLCPAHSISTKD